MISLVAFLVIIGLVVLIIGGIWKSFVKAKQPGWHCIVPLYNYYVMIVRIAQMPSYVFWCVVAFWVISSAIMFQPFMDYINIVSSNPEDIDTMTNAMKHFEKYSYLTWIGYAVNGIVYIQLARKYTVNYPIAFGIGLTLLSFIFWPILGYSSDIQYKDDTLDKIDQIGTNFE